MPIPLPVGKTMFYLGAILVWSSVTNALIMGYTNWGSAWYFAWSPLFIFFGVLLLCAYISDHKVAIVISGIVTLAWWYFIVGW